MELPGQADPVQQGDQWEIKSDKGPEAYPW